MSYSRPIKSQQATELIKKYVLSFVPIQNGNTLYIVIYSMSHESVPTCRGTVVLGADLVKILHEYTVFELLDYLSCIVTASEILLILFTIKLVTNASIINNTFFFF